MKVIKQEKENQLTNFSIKGEEVGNSQNNRNRNFGFIKALQRQMNKADEKQNEQPGRLVLYINSQN